MSTCSNPRPRLLTRWTQSELGAARPRRPSWPALLHFPTWDRVEGQPRQLTALVYRPPRRLPARPRRGPRPVLMLLCGGGGTQCRPGFDPLLQLLVNELGVVVVAPNVRGSAGFGRDFAQAGAGRAARRCRARHRLAAGLDRSAARSGPQPRRAAGRGLRRYLALQSLADYGDRLRGGIAAFPPPLSGLANGAAIRRPVLLVQGLNNPAVPAYEIEQLRSRLRADGVEVQYLAAADEAGVSRANQTATPIATLPPISSRSYCADRIRYRRRGSVRSGGVCVRIVLRDLLNLGLGHAAHEARHHRVLAIALLVFVAAPAPGNRHAGRPASDSSPMMPTPFVPWQAHAQLRHLGRWRCPPSAARSLSSCSRRNRPRCPRMSWSDSEAACWCMVACERSPLRYSLSAAIRYSGCWPASSGTL